MSEKAWNTSPLRRFVYTSPWLPLVFVVLFAVAIYAEFARLPIPRFMPTPLSFIFFSNLCFLLVIAVRFAAQAVRLKERFHYDAGDRPRAGALCAPAPVAAVREKLAAAGFIFASGDYGEKRSQAPLAMTLVYGGLLLALLVGSYDNYWHISGVFLQGEGAPAQLDDESLYFNIVKGPLATLKGMPKLQVRKIIYRDSQWPNGAVELALLDKNNTVVKKGVVAKDGKPLSYKGVEYHLGRFLADLPLLIVTDNLHVEFQDQIKLQPLDAPDGNFTHYASLKGQRLLWNVLYDPVGKKVRLVGIKDGMNAADGIYQFGRDNAVRVGQFVAKIVGMSNWAEIHAVTPRHMLLVYVGSAIALAGVVMRVIFRPQRVWLEETPEGCRVWAVGEEARKAVE